MILMVSRLGLISSELCYSSIIFSLSPITYITWKTVPSHTIKHRWIKIKLKMDKDIFVVFIY